MKKFFSLIAAVLFAGSMMAEPITINATDVTTIETGATTGLDVTLQDVHIVWEGAYYNNENNQDFRIYAGKAMTLTATENISKVEIVGYAKKDLAPVVSAGNITAGASYSAETTKSTWEDPLLVIEEINAQSLTITCNKQMRAFSIRITFEGGDVPPTPAVNYYVAGSMNGWAADEAYMLTPNNQSLYEGEFTFAANDEFKVIGFDGTNTSWFPEGMGNNFVITEAGDYKITFNPAGNVEGWYEGFFNVVKKEAPVAIEVNMSEGLRYDDYVATDGWWQIYGSNEQYIVSISNVSTTQAEGTYTIEGLDPDYTYLSIINGTDTTDIFFVDGSITLSVDAQTGAVTVAGTLVGNDGKSYNLNLQYIVPTPQETVNVNIQNAELIDYYADYGLYGVYGTDANGVYVQLAIWAEQGFQGQFTEEDLDMQYIGSGLMIGDEQVDIYTAAITVTPGNGGDYSITATLLCYNNTQYNVTMHVPASQGQGIEGVDAAVKAIKSIVNGQVVIEKNNKFYNINGAVIR